MTSGLPEFHDPLCSANLGLAFFPRSTIITSSVAFPHTSKISTRPPGTNLKTVLDPAKQTSPFSPSSVPALFATTTVNALPSLSAASLSG